MSKQPPDDHQDWHPPDSVRQRKPHHRAAFDPSLLPQPHPHPHPHHHDQDQDQSTPSRTSPLTEQHSPPQQNDQEAAAASKTKPKPKPRAKRFLAAAGLDHVPREIAWIPGVFTWPKLKPLIRSSIIAWICMLLMLIRPAERTLGSASFIVLIGAFIQPSELPLVAVLEREMFTLLFACAAWVWSIIAIAIAHAVRTNKIPASQANPTAIYNAQYLEARPAIVCAFFLSIGSAVLLYTKVRFGPGPFLFATIFSCILLNVCLSYTPLFPYPFYMLGSSILIPLAVKAAVTTVVSVLFFPKSVNAQFAERLIAVLTPLANAARQQIDLLDRSPLDAQFNFNLVRDLINQSEAGLMPLAMSSRLLTRELSFGLANGQDLKSLERLARAMLAPADGWAYYLSSIRADIETTHFPKTPVPSRLATPAITPIATPRTSTSAEHTSDPQHAKMRQLDEKPSVDPGNERHSSRFQRIASAVASSSRSSSPWRRSHHAGNGHHHHHHHDHHHHNNHHHHKNLFHSIVHRQEAPPVAIWESIRFGNLEAHLHTTASNPITEMFAHLLQESSRDILEANAASIEHITNWLERLNAQRWTKFRDRFIRSRQAQAIDGEKQAQQTDAVIARLGAALETFKSDKRLRVLDPYRDALSGQDDREELDLRAGPGEISKIHHRYLYQAWLHQFHTISFTERLLLLLVALQKIERERTYARFWGPSWPRIFNTDAWRSIGDEHDGHHEAEEDPEHIPGLNGTKEAESRVQAALDLGHVRARDPDALDPEGPLEVLGHRLYFAVRRLFQGHLLFGVKAAILIALVSLPTFMRSSAAWCYENRAIWAIFMAQLALARFRGETAFALVSRLVATLIGAAFALVIWYISTGSGRGNAYGLGATTAVAFPMLMMIRLYFPGPPITSIITVVTAALVVGYSWKDVTNPTFGAPGFGWSVAWRRLVTVAIGVTAAYLFSCLPPSSSLRQHQRLSHATTIAELGKVYCSVVAIATRPQVEEDNSEVVLKRLIALRAKLRRLHMAAANVSYEWSLRGRWPKERYAELFKLQMEISKLLSHCLTVLERLGPVYSVALLRRTRFLDPLFLGDVISVISLCSTALKTASPMPQITACPLVDRFLLFEHGFDVTHTHGTAPPEWLEGLPKKITLATLADQEYMHFSVGVATLFGLVVRIDRLCVAVKQLVGESFAVPADVHRTTVIRGYDWSKRQW